MKKFTFLQVLLFVSIFTLFGFIGARNVFAGFGVSPAGFTHDHLKRGSEYTRKFTISRSDTSDELSVTIVPDLGDLDSWFSISPSTSITLAPGQQYFTFSVTVKVPVDANLKRYTGYIRVLENNQKPKGIQIVEGVRLDVELTLTSKDVIDLLVRNVDIDDISLGDQLVLKMLIENLGNVESSPSKVVVDVMDLSQRSLSVIEVTDLQSIPAGEIQEIYAYFNNDLNEGEYYGNVSIYLGSKVIREELLVFKVNEKVVTLPETGAISKVVREIVDNSGYLLTLIFAILLAFIAWFFILVKIRKHSESKKRKTEFATMILFAKVSLIFLIIAFFIVVILFVKSMIRGGEGEITTLFFKRKSEDIAAKEINNQNILGTENVQVSEQENNGASLVVLDPRTKGKIAIYKTPKRTSEIVYLANQDTTFKVIAELDEWYRVEVPNGKRGWVHKFDIKLKR